MRKRNGQCEAQGSQGVTVSRCGRDLLVSLLMSVPAIGFANRCGIVLPFFLSSKGEVS